MTISPCHALNLCPALILPLSLPPQSWMGLVRVPPCLDLARPEPSAAAAAATCIPPGHAHVAGHVAHPRACIAQESWSGLGGPNGAPYGNIDPLSTCGMAAAPAPPYTAAAANGYTSTPGRSACGHSAHSPAVPPPPPPPSGTWHLDMLDPAPSSARRTNSVEAPAAIPVGRLLRHQSLPVAESGPGHMSPAPAISSTLPTSCFNASSTPSTHGSPCPCPGPVFGRASGTPSPQPPANPAACTSIPTCSLNTSHSLSHGHTVGVTTTCRAALPRTTSEPAFHTSCGAYGGSTLPAVLEAGEPSCPLPTLDPFTTNSAMVNSLCSSGPHSSFHASQHTRAATHRVSHSSCSNSVTDSSPLGTGGLSMPLPLRNSACGIPSGPSSQLLLPQARRATHRSDSLAKTETALSGSYRAMRLAASAASQGLLGPSPSATAAATVPPPCLLLSPSGRLGSCSYGSHDNLASYGTVQSAELYGSPRQVYGGIGTPFLSPTAATLRPLAATASAAAVTVQPPTVSPVPSGNSANARASSPILPAEAAKSSAAGAAAVAAAAAIAAGGSSRRNCRRPPPLQVISTFESGSNVGNGKSSGGAGPSRMASPRGHPHVSPTGVPYTSPLAASSNASAGAALSAAGLLRTSSVGEQGATVAEVAAAVAAAAAAAASGVDSSGGLPGAGALTGAGAGPAGAGADGGGPCCWHEIEAHLVTHGTPGGEPALLLMRWGANVAELPLFAGIVVGRTLDVGEV